MERFLKFILLFSLLISTSSCAVKDKLKGREDFRKAESKDRLWESVKDQNIDFDWYYAKGNIDFDSEDFQIGGQADIRIKKDSLIMLSIRKFGFELARALIRPDSIFIINRLQAQYVAESIDSLKTFYDVPFDYEQLERIIVGNQIIDGQLAVSSIVIEKGNMLNTKGDYLSINYLLNPENRVSFASFKDIEGRSFEVEFDNHKDFDGLNLASVRKYFYPVKTDPEYAFTIKLEKVEIDKPKKISFEIPSDYSKL